MQKNKLIVIFLTLIIMIAVTPFIFSKLMNSKYDTMLLNIKQNYGVKIKENQDKSSYLTTDRYFEVKIPGKTLNIPGVKYVVADIETKFKNLPVTNVEFDGVIKDVVFINPRDNEIFPKFLRGIKFIVITPDFKVYRYRILDTDKNVEGVKFVLKGINGIFNLPEKENKTNGKLVEIANNQILLKIKNFEEIQSAKNGFSQQFKYNIELKAPKFDLNVTNAKDGYSVKFTQKFANVSSHTDVKEILANNGFFEINSFKADINVNHLDKNSIMALREGKKNYEFLNKGFDGNFDLNIKNIRFMQDLGFIFAKGEFKILPGNNVEKLHKNRIDFVNAKFHIEISPKIYEAISNFAPEFKRFFKLQNNKAVANINIVKVEIEKSY